jgi:hypothetical protein
MTEEIFPMRRNRAIFPTYIGDQKMEKLNCFPAGPLHSLEIQDAKKWGSSNSSKQNAHPPVKFPTHNNFCLALTHLCLVFSEATREES